MASSESRVTFRVFNDQFNKALKEMNNESSRLRKEFELQQEQLKLNGSAADKLRAKIDYLQKAHQVASQKVAAAQNQLERAKQVYGENSREVERLRTVLLNAQIQEQRFANQVSQANNELREQSNRARRAADSMNEIGGNMQSAGQDIAGSFGIAAAGIAAGLGVAVKTTMDFDAQLSRVGAIADATDDELKALRKSAIDLGASTSKSATEIAQGQESLAALGFTANDILGAMPGVISAAEASGSDMAQTAEVMASTLNIFGLEASKATKVADVLAKTANISAADLTDMQYALKYAGPPAAALGVSLEELSASIGIMTNAGMQGEQAGTTLRSALLSLLDPSEENSKLMGKMGIQVVDSKKKFVGLSQLIENLSTSMKGQTETQKAATLASLVGKEAVSGMLSLMKAGPAEIDKMTKSLENSGGASAKAAQQMKDNLKGSIDQIMGSIESFMIRIGDALTPVLQRVAVAVQKLADWFNNLSPTMVKFISIGSAITALLLGLVAAFGVVLMVIGGAISGFGALTGIIAGAAEGAGLFSTVIATITGPIGIAIAAIIGLVAVFVTLYKKNEEFRNIVQTVWNQIQVVISQVMTVISQVIQTVMNVVLAFITQKLTQIKAFWSQNGEQIKQAAQNVWSFISKVIQVAMTTIGAIMTVLWLVIKALIISTWDAIKGVVDGALKIILGLIKTFSALFTGDWKGVWQGIKTILTGSVQFIWNLINLMFIGKILGGIKALGMGLLKSVGSMWTGITKLFSTSISGVTNIFVKGFNFLKTFVNQPITTIINIITRGFSTLKTVISTAMNAVRTAIVNGWNKSVSFLKGIDLREIGKNLIQGLIKGITSMIGALQEKVKQTASNVLNTFKKVFDTHSPSKETEKIGQYVSQGLSKGIDKDSPKAIASAKKATANAKKAFEEGFKNIDYRLDAKKINAAQAIQELEKLKEKYKSVPNAVAKVNKEIYTINQKHQKELEELRSKAFEKEKSYIEAKKYYNQLSLTDELALLQKNMAKYKANSEERIYYEREVYRVKQEINQKIISINDEYAQKISETNQKLIDEEKRLTDEYNNAVADRTKALYSFKGLFDEVSLNTEITGQKLVENLQSQVTTFIDWQKNIEELSNKNLDVGLIDELRAMGPNAAAEIAALNSLSMEELQKYSDLWKQKNTLAKDQAMLELEGMKADTQTKITELREQTSIELEKYKNEWINKIKEIRKGTTDHLNMKDSLKTIGTNTIQGLIEGMNSMVGPLMAQAESIANAVSGTIKKALDIHSPSRVLEWMGKMTGAGLQKGMASSISGVKSMAQQMADAAIPQVRIFNNDSSPMASNGIQKIEQHIEIHSPTPLSPSETARQNQMVLERLAFQFRG